MKKIVIYTTYCLLMALLWCGGVYGRPPESPNGIKDPGASVFPPVISVKLTKVNIPMGQENGKIIEVKVSGGILNAALTRANWHNSTLPSGVTVGSIVRNNDTTANIVLSGNSPINYSRTVFTLTVDGNQFQNPDVSSYTATGNVVFDGNPNWTLIYSDEFNYEGLPDREKWTITPRPKGDINSEQQVYTDSVRDNARVRNGNLIITGKKDFPTNNPSEPWSSARVASIGKMEFQYGKVEMRAKLPKARGSWPAFWLMPTTSDYGFWPKSGEVDIMEHTGNRFGSASSAVHTFNKNWTNGGNLGGGHVMLDLDTVYHVYALEWSPDSLRFSHDGVAYYTYVNPKTDWKDWPFDKPFYVILNIAMGGGMGGTIVDADWPDSMVVDYVRVSQKGLGTPVLDSISVTPANIAMLSGKTHQYMARILDQNNHVLTGVTPVWSVTGTGNSITSSGLATINSTGVVKATATYNSVTLSGTTNATVRVANYKTIPARIEAENFDNANSCCTEQTSDTSGVINVSYIRKDTWFEYDLNVPDNNAYRIRFRVAVNTLSSLRIENEGTLLSTMQLPASGGWGKWITVTSAPIVFGQGQKTIRVTSGSLGWNFNWLQIVPEGNHQVQQMVLRPDSARVLVGDTLQYSALGYDADTNYIMLSPAPVFTISGSGNSINSTGVLKANTVGARTITITSGALSRSVYVNIVAIPILTRIDITPNSGIVPVGTMQKYTAKGYDQYNAPIPIREIIWTVTGSGNIMDSTTGLLKAGTTPGTFTVKAESAMVISNQPITIGYGCSVNNKYEAESAASRAAGPVLEATDDVGGGQHFSNVTTGKWFQYVNLKVPYPGKYNIHFRVLTTAPAKIKVGHGTYTFRIIDVPSTNGQWQTISDTLTLPTLTYTGVSGYSGTFKFNWFIIDNCVPAPPCVLIKKQEAESVFYKDTTTALEICTDTGGGQNFTIVNNKSWFAYNTLSVPAAGLYKISFRISSTVPSRIWVGHGNTNFGYKDFPSTDGVWQTISDTITLPALQYTGIHGVSGNFKFNWFTIEDCGGGTSQSSNISFADPYQKNGEDIKWSGKASVYPNPANTNILILPGHKAYRVINVYDSWGRRIETWSIPEGTTTIPKDISKLAVGIYFLQFVGRDKQETLRIIKN